MPTEPVCSHCGWRWGWHAEWCPDYGKDAPAALDLASMVTRQRSEIDTLRASADAEAECAVAFYLEFKPQLDQMIALASALQDERDDLRAKLGKAISWSEFTDEQLDELGFEPVPPDGVGHDAQR